MATFDKILTDKSPSVLIGANTILFDKLILRTGDFAELEIIIRWKAKDPQQPNSNTMSSFSVPFRPVGYEDTNTVPSIVHQFRKDFSVPLFPIGENTGVELIAFSDSGKPFDFTLFLEIDPLQG